MTAAPKIRLYQPSDLPQVLALEAQVQPYRPEDQAEVEEMFQRARAAEQSSDHWAPIPVTPDSPPSTPLEQGYLALWVAVLEDDGERIAGMAGVGRPNFDILPAKMPYVQDLQQRKDYVELQHVRVSPDARGLGVGTLLCQTVIDWSRQNGYQMLLVNTTTPQHPARNLYQKLGFQEKAVTYIGLYELIWMEKDLREPAPN